MLVEQAMRQNPLICCKDNRIQEVCEKLYISNANCAIVVDETGSLAGVFTPRNLIETVAWQKDTDGLVGDAVVVIPRVRFDQPLETLNIGDFEIVPVVNDVNKPIGLLYREDVLRVNITLEVNKAHGLLNSIPVAVALLDGEGKVVLVNQAILEVFECSIQKIAGNKIQEAFPIIIEKALKTGQFQTEKDVVLGLSSYNIEATPILVDSRVVRIIMVLKEVTQLQDVMDKLTAFRRYGDILKTVFDNANEAICVVDERGKITMLNQAYCDFLNINPKEFIGKHVTEIIENTRLHLVIKTGQAELSQIQRVNGKDIICNRLPIKENGKVVGAVCQMLFRDVKDLKSFSDRIIRMQSELDFYKNEVRRYQGTKYTLDNVVGESAQITKAKDMLLKVARTQSTVLIRGESGTGKELFAHALHNVSPRATGPFVKVNCAALPENLLESELFGYSEGAFTGAKKGGKPGKFEVANGGTIFLDEIGDMPLNMQVKLLRVLQEKEFERLGDSNPIKVDVRIVSATHGDLEKMVGKNQFREDLFYRLNVITLEIPPLRQRREDIPLLIDALLDMLAEELGTSRKSIDPMVLDVLLNHSWPGNVRELENVLERALNIADGNLIKVNHLPLYLLEKEVANTNKGLLIPLKQVLKDTEYAHLKRALALTSGDCLEAAKLLSVSKSTFYEKATKYGLK